MKVPISSVAEMLGVTQRTIRIWDEEGIVKPERSPKNRRLYTEQNIEEARAVSFMLNEMGLNINGVKVLKAVYNMDENSGLMSFLDFVQEFPIYIGLNHKQMQANKQSNKSKGRKKVINAKR